MGFHKRHIDKDNIIAFFKRDGIEGLKQLLSADALIIHGNVDTDRIIEYLKDDNVEDLTKLVEELDSQTEVE